MGALEIEHYYCISLSGREDRRAILEPEWARLGVSADYFVRDKDSENPVRGCFESHVAVAKDAQAKGYRRILVLEDDFKFIDFDDSQFQQINRFLDSPAMADIDLFYLGHFPKDVWLSEYSGIAYVKGNGTHAYVLDSHGIDRIAALEFSGVPIDSYYKKHFSAMSAFPMICIQQPEELASSDISTESNVEDDDGWGRRLRKERRLAYVSNMHKSAWNRLKGWLAA